MHIYIYIHTYVLCLLACMLSLFSLSLSLSHCSRNQMQSCLSLGCLLVKHAHHSMHVLGHFFFLHACAYVNASSMLHSLMILSAKWRFGIIFFAIIPCEIAFSQRVLVRASEDLDNTSDVRADTMILIEMLLRFWNEEDPIGPRPLSARGSRSSTSYYF